MIDFDEIDTWEPILTEKLKAIIPAKVFERVVGASPEEPQDTCKLLLDGSCRQAVINEVVTWVHSGHLAGYHGTRLTEAEMASIRKVGLLPMKAEQRRDRLHRALSSHENWPEVADRVEGALRAFGPGEGAGEREGQVHLTISKSGLVNEFNQYLTHGADIDRHIAFELLGQEGVDLLAQDGDPRVIVAAVPGNLALAAANPIWSVEELLEKEKVPNLIYQLLCSWSYRLVHPDFQCRTLHLDCGLLFQSVVPPEWIIRIESPY